MRTKRAIRHAVRGQIGTGTGAIYVGKGTILGVDIGGLRYNGTYTEGAGRLKGNIMLFAPHGATLVNGQRLSPGASLQLTVDWPVGFANGQPQTISVGGLQVQVKFEKIGDIP